MARRERTPVPKGYWTIWSTVALDLVGFGIIVPILGRYAERFGDHKPARTTVQVSALPKGGAVEIDLIDTAGDQPAIGDPIAIREDHRQAIACRKRHYQIAIFLN